MQGVYFSDLKEMFLFVTTGRNVLIILADTANVLCALYGSLFCISSVMKEALLGETSTEDMFVTFGMILSLNIVIRRIKLRRLQPFVIPFCDAL